MNDPTPQPVPYADPPEDLARWFVDPALPGGGFANPWGVNVEPAFSRFLRWQTEANPWRRRKRSGPTPPRLESDPLGALLSVGDAPRCTWLGHASVLITVDDVTFLVDPVFGRVFPGIPRKAPAPLTPDDLPHVDVVAITHGHYDHLDAASVKAVAKRFPEALFVTPLGLSRSLPKAARRRVELSWWQQVVVSGVRVALVPAQHWHRRGPADTNRALWGGYVVAGSRAVYHSGDTGSFGGFSAIGHAFPALDLAVLPIGAWEPRWFMGDQHMDPDGSVEAFLATGARRFLSMHWNTFDLTDEPLDEGPDELARAVERADLPFDDRWIVPQHGQTVVLG